MSDMPAPAPAQPGTSTAFHTPLRVRDKWSGSGGGLHAIDLFVATETSQNLRPSLLYATTRAWLYAVSPIIFLISDKSVLCLVFLTYENTICLSIKDGYSPNIFLSENQNVEDVLE